MPKLLLACLAVLAFARPALAADDGLSPLAAALAQVRSTQGANVQRDAGPELTPVKHLLRAWVERQLPEAAVWPPTEAHPYASPDLAALSARLSQALADADLTCRSAGAAKARCVKDDEDDARGYLGDVRLGSLDLDRYLVVVTNVGVRCGYDQSAYIYARGPGGAWRLLFESEQDDYGDKLYAPQNLLSISVSPADVSWTDPAPPPLVATLGFSPWCQSNWQGLYTRLWRASAATPDPTPLVDRDESLYMGDDFVAGATLSDHDLLVEYRGPSVDTGVLIRTHVEHDAIGPGDRVTRIAPVALNPADFVDEWLTTDWSGAARWLDPQADPAALAGTHAALKDYGEFDGPPTRCRPDPTLWQVAFAKDQTASGLSSPDRYLLVRWMAPYRFTLLRAAAAPFPGCDEADALDDNVGAFFSQQGWTP